MYLAYYFILIFLSFFYDFSKWKIYKKILILLLFSFVFLFAGMRSSDIGTDTNNYAYIIDNLKNYNISVLEPLFYILLKSIDKIFYGELRYVVLFCFFSFFTWFAFFKSIVANKISVGLFFIVGFSQTNLFFDQFNTIRQLLSMSIVFFALPLIFNKKYTKYYIYIIFASLFHYSALIALLFPLLYFFKNYWKTVVIVSAFLLYFLYEFIFKFFILINERYDSYKEEALVVNFIGNGALIFNLLILILVFSFKKKVSLKFSNQYDFFLILVTIGFVFQLLISYLNVGGLAAIRSTYYFLFGYIFLLNYIYYSIQDRQRMFFWFICFILFSIKFLFLLNATSLPAYSMLDYSK